ncbi:MAG TPA: carotenoid biosynthesis protein [Ktedonobacterales bacterium]
MNGMALKALWGVVALYAAMNAISSLRSGAIPVSVLVLFLVAFVLLHGALRYGWGGIAVFIAIALVVSNILENVSILTGFPFGHYHYTDALGAKLFLVPLLIGPAYIGTGYLAWVIGTVLAGDIRRDTSAFTLVAVPLVASFAMVVWDLCFDPTLSTILKFWVWEQGGGYFGVPLTNYLGWYLTVYLFYQGFALFLRFGPARRASVIGAGAIPATFYLEAIVTYAVIGLSFVLQYLSATNHAVSDATGAVWQTGAIHETSAIVSLLTMVFIAALATVKLRQAPGARGGRAVERPEAVAGAAS